ncbi:MAG: porin family protein [Thermodesulfovibrionales bacterium]|nr:porin family protein [Thermodesulfovibrionales bacterium]
MRKTAILVLAILLVSAAPAWAQTEAGMSELGMSISSQKLKSDDAGTSVNTTIINVLYGYFFTDAIELAGNLNVIENDFGNTETTQTGFELQLKYHFIGTIASFLPYLGVQAGVYGLDDGTDELKGSSAGFMGGAKYFVSEKTSVNLEYNYRMMTLEDDNDNSYDATVTVLGIGCSVYF